MGVAEIRMTGAELAEYLDNWGRWLLDQADCWPMGYAWVCPSAEGGWHSPQCWDPPQPHRPVFVQLAYAVEDAVHAKGFLERWRRALVAENVQWPAWRLMDAGVKPNAWDEMRAVAAAQAPRTYLDSLRQGTGALAIILATPRARLVAAA
jgi:hypothetical protein